MTQQAGPFAFIGTNDLVAMTRGRALPLADINFTTGVGWVPADLAVTAMGGVAEGNPFGALGDLRLVPDKSTEVVFAGLRGGLPVHMFIADQVRLDGQPWECCPRTQLKNAVAKLKDLHGLELSVAFEHEFIVTRNDGVPMTGHPMAFDSMREVEPFGSELAKAFASAGIPLENWLPEYGAGQFEYTTPPADPLTAADRAVITKDLARDVAARHDMRASFAPLPHPTGVGNGLHIHFSLRRDGKPASYDADGLGRMTREFQSAAAGILEHARGLLAITAPSQISFLRLTPHRWSAGGVCVGDQNREALLRICPIPAGSDPEKMFNLEYRAADATANPWLTMAAMIYAMVDGLDRGLTLDGIVEGEVEESGAPMLPATLDEAIDALKADAIMNSWFAADLMATHIGIRATEKAAVAELDDAAKCALYATLY